jgi:ATP-dependent Lon protease
MNEKTKSYVMQKINQLATSSSNSSEYHKSAQWIDTMSTIPFGNYASIPIKNTDDYAKKADFLTQMKKNFDLEVYGHDDAKDQLIRVLAQWITNNDSKGISIGIHGPMGCGKTSFVKSICKSLNMPYDMVALGGISDGAYLEGHSYTYEGSRNGKIIDILIKAKCMNPIIFFDELDKISETSKGNEITNILIHMTDSVQNDKFSDKYFSELEIDLSRCIFIFSYNDEKLINPILKDRMVTIKTSGYETKDKLKICLEYMIPSVLSEYKLTSTDVLFSSDTIKDIINLIDEEKGVRNLKRAIHDIISNINLQRLLNADFKLPHIVDKHDIKRYIHGKKTNEPLNHMYL